MKLCIGKEYDKSFVEDTCKLATYMLSMKSTHLFVAANSWDVIEIELDDSIPDDCLKTFALSGSPIKVKLPDEITSKTVKLLCDLYAERAGSIRKAYMTGTPIKEVLSECLI